MKVTLVSLLLLGLASYTHAWASDRFSCDCGWRNSGRIGGGKETKRNEYPWQAAIGYKANNMTYCAGALVTQWHVITAAKCLTGKNPNNIFLYVGNFFSEDDFYTQRRNVEKIMIHPSYDLQKNIHNIAIAMASREFVYTTDRLVGPVCMPTSDLDLVGKTVKVTGWGSWTMDKTEYDHAKLKPLKEADLDVISHRICEQRWRKICVEGEGITIGRGDGGDPMVWLDGKKFTLVGITTGYSNSDQDADKKVGVAAKVPAYLKWINEQISSTKSEAKTCYRE